MLFKEQETMSYYLSHLFPYLSNREQENLFSLTNYVINCRRGCKHSPFSSCYGCISWVLRTLSLSVCTCPFSTPMPYQNTTTSTGTKAMLSCNELMNTIWEHRSSHSSLSSIAICTNTSVDIFSRIKTVILINVESIGVTISPPSPRHFNSLTCPRLTTQ